MNLEFRKECGLNSVVQSLSAIAKYGPNQAAQYSVQTDQRIELDHTIRLENESNILLKGRTIWIPKKCLQPNWNIPNFNYCLHLYVNAQLGADRLLF